MSGEKGGVPAWARLWWDSVVHSLPLVVGLALLTLAAHAWRPDFGLAHQLISKAAWGFYEIHMGKPPKDEAEVVVMTMRPEDVRGRFTLADSGSFDAPPVLEEARPVDRKTLARALTQLAGELKPHLESVLALDVDVTPRFAAAGCAATPSGEGMDEMSPMADALAALRLKFRAVVVLALPRESCAERSLRRKFLLAAGCTSRNHPSVSPLYIASARLEVDDYGQVSSYLGRRPGLDNALPRRFPSLGTVLRLASTGGPMARETREVLESQCEAATGASALLVEERPRWNSEARKYVPDLIDWRAISDGRILQSPLEVRAEGENPTNVRDLISSRRARALLPPAVTEARASAQDPAAAVPAPALPLADISAPEETLGPRPPRLDASRLAEAGAKAIILAFDGGPFVDQHPTPAYGPVSGAMLHAIVAATDSKEVGPTESLAIDLVAGVLFVAVWSALDTRLRGEARGLSRIHVIRRRFAWRVPTSMRDTRATWARYLQRAGLFLGVLLLVFLGTLGLIAKPFDLGIHDMTVIVTVSPHFAASLGIASVVTAFVVAITTDSLCFGQSRQAMPWLASVARRVFPLVVVAFVTAIALLFGLDSLVSRARQGFHDPTLIIGGVLLHCYMELTHQHGKEHLAKRPARQGIARAVPRLRVRIRHSARVVHHDAPGLTTALHRLDAILHLTAWTVLTAGAVYLMTQAFLE
jgi:hypothetical protein